MARVLLIVPGSHRIDGVVHPVAVWRPEVGFLAASTAVLGGGLGPRRWVLNASVGADYRDPAPSDHLRRIARAQGLDGDGIGLMTAVDVRDSHWAGDDGVEALATVGLGWPTWAAAEAEPASSAGSSTAGTINSVVWVPVALSEAALVNALTTATEAKAQALIERGVPGTGTASDAVAVCCPLPPVRGDGEAYGGPRSTWGSRVGRAVHTAVSAGAAKDRDHRVRGATSPGGR